MAPPTDTPSLLPNLAPCLSLRTHHPFPWPPRLPDRRSPHGQAQTYLGPFNRLRRLCCRDRLQRCVCDRQKDGTKEILQADYAAGSAEEYQYGADGEEVGGWGGVEESRKGDATEKQVKGPEAGKIEGYVIISVL